MARLAFFLPLLFAIGCAGPPPEPPKVRVSQWRDMKLESRTLKADTAFAAFGMRSQAEHDDGSTRWNAHTSDLPRETTDGFLRREFRITIANRDSVALEFHARLDYFDSDQGALLKRREIDHMVAPPFIENTWIGSVMIREPGGAELVARILPASENFDAVAESEGGL
ncbi:MAG: hypothetical protein ABR524_01160 [Thermoanaerobaculia bacterium]